nr:MAG TPA: hypothetical protein [Caudoviricetes sp.]
MYRLIYNIISTLSAISLGNNRGCPLQHLT